MDTNPVSPVISLIIGLTCMHNLNDCKDPKFYENMFSMCFSLLIYFIIDI